jgi:hypothetical protein
MKSIWLLSAFLAVCPVANGATPGPVMHNVTFIEEETDWTGWLAKNFPDASKAWPAAAGKSFERFAGGGKWDYVGKGDIDRDGSPTGLLIQVRKSAHSGDLVVTRLRVVKWMAKDWTELLNLDAKEGTTVDGVKPGAMESSDFRGYSVMLFAGDPEDAKHPGMVLMVQAVDAHDDTVTEDADYFFVPSAKKYGGESD